VTILRAAMVGGGVALVVLTARSIVGTLIVPRGLSSWISRAVGRATRAPFVFVADRCTRYETKDRVLAPQAPLTLLALLLCWLGLFLVAYTALVFGLSDIGLGEALRQAGSSLFTLGFDTSRQADVTALEFAAAATGPLVIALQIAYLPTIYAAYNRRETDVTLLQSRAGEPAWGPEVLARHRLVNILDSLPEFYRGWERWAADVAESHTNYPSLIDFRSPRPLRSWVVGLLAVLDSAALYLAIAPSRAPSEARLCLRMGFTCLREICDALRLPYDPDPRPDLPLQLEYAEFLGAVHRLEEVAFPMERTPEEAWAHFRGWRVNYEGTAYALAARLDAVPALWSGSRRRSAAVMAPDRPPDRLPESPDVTHPPSYGRFKA
jgi:hypothetical protein